MSQEEIDRLVVEHSLVREQFDDDDVAGFWAKAVSSFADARVRGISRDGAFQHVYTAALQATLAVLAAHGLCVKSTANHYRAFFAMQKLEDALRPHGILFDKLRATRHESVYEPREDETEIAEQLAQALTRVPPALMAIRASILAARPTLANRLLPIR